MTYWKIEVKDRRDVPGMERHNDVDPGPVIWHAHSCVRTDLDVGEYYLVPVEDIDNGR